MDPTLDALDWRALRDSLSARGIDPAKGVTARSWIQAGKLGVALGATTPIVCACDDPHHLPFRNAPDGYPAIVVEHAQPWKRSWRPASVALSDRLGPLDSLGAITLARAEHPAVTLVIYRRHEPPQLLPLGLQESLRASKGRNRKASLRRSFRSS